MELVYTHKFKRSFKNICSRYPKMEDKILEVIQSIDESGDRSSFFRKRFLYRGRKMSEFAFGGDWRMLVEVLIENNKIYLLNVGSHASLELSSNKKLNI